MMKSTITRCFLTGGIALSVAAPAVVQADEAQLKALIERAEKAAVRAEAAAKRLEASVSLIEQMSGKDEVVGALTTYIASLPRVAGKGFGYRISAPGPVTFANGKYVTTIENFGIEISERRNRSEVVELGPLTVTATKQENGLMHFVATSTSVIRGQRYKRGALRGSENLLRHDGLTITATWNPTLQMMTATDLGFSNVRLARRRYNSDEKFGIDQLNIGKVLDIAADDSWKGTFHLKVKGLSLQDGGVRKVGELNYTGHSAGTSMSALLKAEQQITQRLSTGFDHIDEDQLIAQVKPLLQQFDAHGQTLEVKDVSVQNGPSTKFGLGYGKLSIDLKGNEREAVYELALADPMLPQIPVPAALIPNKFTAKGKVADLPKGMINKIFDSLTPNGGASSGIKKLLELPHVKNSDVLQNNSQLREHLLRHPMTLENQELRKMLNITDADMKLVNLEQSGPEGLLADLMAAGITITGESSVQNGIASLSQDTSLVVDGDAKHQVVGKSVYLLQGLDAMQQLVRDEQAKAEKSKAPASHELQSVAEALAFIAAMSDRKEIDGKKVDVYVLDVQKDGSIKLNGKDVSELAK